jgi:hypothetical protein
MPCVLGHALYLQATCDLLRRRIPLMRTRAEVLTPIQHTNSQYHVPEIGKKIAYKAKGTKLGHADLQWACSEAAVLFCRAHPAGQKSLTRLEKTHGKGTA